MPRETVRMTQRSTARIYARKNQNRGKKGEIKRKRDSTFISRSGNLRFPQAHELQKYYKFKKYTKLNYDKNTTNINFNIYKKKTLARA